MAVESEFGSNSPTRLPKSLGRRSAGPRLSVFCAHCGRVVMRVDRIDARNVKRLRVHLRVAHPTTLITPSADGALKHFRLVARGVEKAPPDNRSPSN